MGDGGRDPEGEGSFRRAEMTALREDGRIEVARVGRGDKLDLRTPVAGNSVFEVISSTSELSCEGTTQMVGRAGDIPRAVSR